MKHTLIKPSYDPWTNYCFDCLSEIEMILQQYSLPYTSFEIEKATRENVYPFLIEEKTNFVIGYGHGNENCFCGHKHCEVIQINDDEIFLNNIFYFYACLTGAKLGQNIIDKGGVGFLGYKNIIYVNLLNKEPFSRTANAGLIKMIAEKCDLYEAYKTIQEIYIEEMNNCIKNMNFETYNLLKDNYNALVFIDKSESKI